LVQLPYSQLSVAMARIEVAIGVIALALTNINDVAIMSRQDVDVII
jgi:hypothetical protein